MESKSLFGESFQHLPNELLKRILSYLPTHDLRFHCRFVNSKWWEFATEVCHDHRCIELKTIDSTKGSSHLRKMAWSSYSYDHNVRDVEGRTPFLSKFGYHLRILNASNVRIIDEFGTEVLNLTPNLQSLSVEGNFNWEDKPSGGKFLALKKLRSLTISGSIQQESHVHWFVQQFGQSPLKTISVRLAEKWGNTNVDMPLIAILTKAPTVSVSVSTRHHSPNEGFLKAFLTPAPKMEKFGFWIGSIPKDGDTSNKQYEIIAKILENSSETIVELKMGGDGEMECIPFKFPFLSKLKLLELGFPTHDNAFLTTLFSGLKPFHVPVLECIKISDLMFPPPPNVINLFQLDLVLETVSVLIVKSTHRFRDDWSKILPNLKKLKTKIFWSEFEVGRIYNLKHLEKLELKAYVSGEYVENASQLFSGIPITQTIENMTDEEINEIKQKRSLPYISKLTKLKELKLEFLGTCPELNDSVEWTFLKMNPMKLSLIKTNMSDAMKEKLATHHILFCS